MDPADVLSIDEQRRVVGTLLRLTLEERVTWQVGPDANKFSLMMGQHRYEFRSRDKDGVAPFALDVYEGSVLLSSINTRRRGLPGYDPRVNSALTDMYEFIYRKVNRPEDAVRRLISELDNIDQGKEPPF